MSFTLQWRPVLISLSLLFAWTSLSASDGSLREAGPPTGVEAASVADSPSLARQPEGITPSEAESSQETQGTVGGGGEPPTGPQSEEDKAPPATPSVHDEVLEHNEPPASPEMGSVPDSPAGDEGGSEHAQLEVLDRNEPPASPEMGSVPDSPAGAEGDSEHAQLEHDEVLEHNEPPACASPEIGSVPDSPAGAEGGSEDAQPDQEEANDRLGASRTDMAEEKVEKEADSAEAVVPSSEPSSSEEMPVDATEPETHGSQAPPPQSRDKKDEQEIRPRVSYIPELSTR